MTTRPHANRVMWLMQNNKSSLSAKTSFTNLGGQIPTFTVPLPSVYVDAGQVRMATPWLNVICSEKHDQLCTT